MAVVALFVGGCAKAILITWGHCPIKRGKRGTFVADGSSPTNEEELSSPVGATITGINGAEDGLAPEDPFWDSKKLPMVSAHLSLSSLALISTTSVQMNVQNSGCSHIPELKPRRQNFNRRIL